MVNSLPNGIDGISALEGRTVMFYNTGIPQEKGFVSALFDTHLLSLKTISVSQTIGGTLRCGSTDELIIGNQIAFTAPVFGGIQTDTSYYINSIHNSTDFMVSSTPGTPISISVSETRYTGNNIILNDTSALTVGDRIHFTGATYGNIAGGVYYVKTIINSTSITISEVRFGTEFELINWVGEMTLVTDIHAGITPTTVSLSSYISSVSMVGNINDNLYDEGKYRNSVKQWL